MKHAVFLAVLLGMIVVAAPSCASVPQTPATSAISREPLYAGLVTRAGQLKEKTDGFAPSLATRAQSGFDTYVRDIRALAEDDMKAHLDLKARGTDSDLKCILKGVSLDLNIKMDAILAATTDAEAATAYQDMSLLLSDNIDVIVTPATAESGLDCVIEFGAG
ncbi:hypothetical protein ABI_10010 [Asticcacaulis biprosthecium C19]|uniref:Lipoprotein n=1 Tax=Asticcacaulis biprosthecium C19 TaxID=715226 RepID=F4QH27_9CAUL|nr:hypothetical protein [Asticcacaulis biprosthecium]EGF92564.1 hypothetical protein ABI_10010 [Asticcacaulis biprosthecium C19]